MTVQVDLSTYANVMDGIVRSRNRAVPIIRLLRVKFGPFGHQHKPRNAHVPNALLGVRDNGGAVPRGGLLRHQRLCSGVLLASLFPVRQGGHGHLGWRAYAALRFHSLIGIISGLVMGKTGYYVPWYILTSISCISGAACLYTVNESTELANIYDHKILLGLGSGAATQLTFAVASMKLLPADIRRSTGWEAFVQLGGPTISLSIAQAIFINKAQSAVGSLLPSLNIEEISTIIPDPASELLRSLSDQMQCEVERDVVNTMHDA